MKRVWKLNSFLKANLVNEGIFIFEFGNTVDCNRILAKRPWNFNGALLIFSHLEGDERRVDLVLKKVSFWVQIHALQLRHMTAQMGRLVSKCLGMYKNSNARHGEWLGDVVSRSGFSWLLLGPYAGGQWSRLGQLNPRCYFDMKSF